MMRAFVFACCLAVLLGGAVPGFAAEEASDSIPAAPDKQTDGLFIDPSFLLSTFVTDKGTIRRRTDQGPGRTDLNLHTGDWNWIFYPNLALGWDWGGWQFSMRAAYNMHLAKFDLPYGQTAKGEFTSLEIGPELYADVLDFGFSTLEIGGGVGARLLAAGNLDYYAEDGGAYMSRDFEGDSTISGLTFHVGGGGELMSYSHVRLGWMMRFYYGTYTMDSDERTVDLSADVDTIVTDEQLEMGVYSAFFGLRLRIFPLTSRGKK